MRGGWPAALAPAPPVPSALCRLLQHDSVFTEPISQEAFLLPEKRALSGERGWGSGGRGQKDTD